MDITYDGRAGTAEGVVLVRTVGRDVLPPVESRSLKLAGRHGLYYFGFTYAARTITVGIVLAEITPEGLRSRIRSIAAWLHPRGVRRLIFSDEPDRFYDAVLAESTDFTQLAAGGECTLSFLCPDPFAYAITPQLISMTVSPHTYTQVGTAPADPLLRLQGISSGAGGQQISIAIGTQVVTYRGALATGEWLEIDCRDKTAIRLVGAVRTNVIMHLERPVFPQLAAGGNTVTVTAAGGATWSTLEIHCRNRWL